MQNYFIFLIIILTTFFLITPLFYYNFKLDENKPQKITIDLNIAHNVINKIGLNDKDNLFTSQIKQLFIKNKKVNPDMIEHLAEHYKIPVCEIYIKIKEIINQPMNC